ncbi:RidA family protein [Caballeronia sp. 15711]|uniref:RidA family protein n=1 Tax=Caballeronia sp. 15711 TaxID=3391029 RepID=UPI0039E37803
MPFPISRRQSLHLEGVSHGSTPIPMGSRIANVIYTSGISGIDRATSKLALDAAAQARHAFLNLRDLLASAGSGLEDVIRLTVYLKSETSRQHVNEHWLACFPDPGSRPARHILMYELQHGMEIQLEAICVIQKSEDD